MGYEWLKQEGATATGTTLEDNGSSYVAYGVATGTTVETGGLEYVYSSGSSVDTIVSSGGGLKVGYRDIGGGSTTGTIVSSGGYEAISGLGATTTGTTILSGGSSFVVSGIASATTVENGGMEVVHANGSAVDTTAESGGVVLILTGGTTTGTMLAGTEYVTSDGAAFSTTVGSGGTEIVSSGGLAVSTSVGSGGTELVSAGGSTDSLQVASGGTVSDFGTTSGTVMSGGTFDVQAGGVAFETVVGRGAVLNDDAGGVANDVSAAGGTVNLASGAHLAGGNVDSGTFNLLSGYSQSALVLAGNGIVNVSAGADAGSAVTFDGTVNFLAGVTSSGVVFTGGGQVDLASGASNVSAVLSGFGQVISGGATATATTLTNGQDVVLSGGSAVGTILKAGGEYVSGGTAVGTVISGASEQAVVSDGTAIDTLVSGGSQAIAQGGTAIDATFIGVSAVQDVYIGGAVTGTLLESGARQYVGSGTASGTVVDSASFQYVSAGTVTGTVLSGGASIIISDGTAVSTTIGTSGSLTLLSGGTASGGIVFSGNDAILAVEANSAITAPISGFAFTDGIEISGMQFSVSNSFAVSGNELIVTSGGISNSFVIDGAQSDTFALVGFGLTSGPSPGIRTDASFMPEGPAPGGTGTEIILVPQAPGGLTLASGSDSGIQGDDITDVTTPVISGIGVAGDTIILYDGATVVGSALVGEGGDWSVATSGLTLGANVLSATQTDTTNDVSPASAPLTVTLVTPPTAPSPPVLAAGSDSGIKGDGSTDVTTPVVSGTGADGDTVILYNGQTAVGSATVVDGNWAVTTTTLTPGTYSLTASQVDVYGDATPAASPLALTIVAPPPVPTLALAPGSDSGIQGDGITDVATPTITGTGANGDVVTVYDDEVAVGSATVVNGTWAITTTTLAPGNHSLDAVQVDGKGDSTVAAAALPLEIVAPPPAPSTPVLAAGSDSGIPGDGTTDVATPTITGTGANGDVVTVYNGFTAIGSATVVDGTWAITTTTLAPGTYGLTASQMDQYGDVTAAASALPLTIVAAPGAPTLALAPGSDSGIKGDGVTDVAAPTITGTGINGEVITLYNGAVALGSATVVSGNWSIAAGTLAVGPQTLTATATDGYGDPSTSASLPLTIVAPPEAPSAPVLAAGSDSGIQGDGVTDVAAPTLSGTGVSGDTVIIYNGDVAVGSATVVDGTWAITTATLAPGTYGLTASQVDQYGDATQAASPLPLTIVGAPGAPTLALAPGSDSGVQGDGVTDVAAPTITGTGMNGEVITLYNGDVALGSATVVSGTWSIAAGTLNAGAQTLTAVATDSHGDPSTSASLPLTIVAAPDAPSAPVLAAGSDSGIQGDGVTDVAAPTLSGTGVSGDTVIIYNGEVAVGSATVVDGTWAVTTSTLAPGKYELTAAQVDGYGDATPAASPLPLTIVAAPVAPTLALAAGSDTGTKGDGITSIVTPVISGTGISGETVIVYDGATVVGSATVGDGTWSITTTTLAAGAHALTATQVDGYGDASAASPVLALGIDVTAVTDTSFVLGNATAALSVGVVAPTNPLYSAGQLAIAISALPTNGALTLADGTAVSVGEQLTSAQLTGLLFTPAAGSDSTSSLAYIVTAPSGDTTTGTVAFNTGDTGGAPVISTGSEIPNTATPTISGTALANSAITLLDNGTAIGTATADANGAYSVTAGVPLSLGLDRLTVQDALPDSVATSSAPLIVFDVEAPVAGVSTSDFASDDIGAAMAQGARLAFVGGTEAVQLVDGTLSVGPDTGEAAIQRLYEGLLGRSNDTSGISYYDKQLIGGASEVSVAAQFLTSSEYIADTGTQTDAQFVASLYQGFLGRSAAADPGSTYWTNLLASGVSRATVTIGISDSPEAKTALGLTTEQVWVPHAPGTLAHELYETGLGREVELPALANFNKYFSALTPAQFAAQIASSPEFLADHGSQSNAAYVGSLYTNGLGRTADVRGLAYWTNELNSGTATRGGVLLGIATSPEAAAHLTTYLGK